ncbi:MAG: FAD-dependent oxidoreductase [Patescibacteria group bacterium]
MAVIYDTIIIGGGPAATGAGVYAARKRMKTLLLTESFGGQSIVSDDIQNWIGEPHVSGIELMQKLKAHLSAYADVLEIKEGVRATEVVKIKCRENRICDFVVTTTNGTKYTTKTVIVTTGARRRMLGVPGEAKLNGKGVAYCSTCDAPLFKGKTVAVVGGGNAGLEAVEDLFPYAEKVYLLVHGDAPTGDPVVYAKVKGNEKLSILTNAEIKKVSGDTFLTSITYTVDGAKEERELPVSGLFIEIGSVPNSEPVASLVDLDKAKQVVVNPRTCATSQAGIFSAGDVTDDPFKQNNISAGDGVKAALSAYYYLMEQERANPMLESADAR